MLIVNYNKFFNETTNMIVNIIICKQPAINPQDKNILNLQYFTDCSIKNMNVSFKNNCDLDHSTLTPKFIH